MRNGSYSERLVIAANQNTKERDYWLNQMAGGPEKAAFFYDYPGTVTDGEEMKMESSDFELPADLGEKLSKLCNQSDVRLHIILLASIAALLFKYTGNTDIVLGTPIYRQDQDSDFINTVLAIRSRISSGMTFKDLLLQVREAMVKAVENQNFPVEVLVDRLGLSWIDGEFPLFDVAVVLENIQAATYFRAIPYQVLFSFMRDGSRLHLQAVYNGRRFQATTIGRLAGHLFQLLLGLLPEVNREIAGIDLLTEAERDRILFDFNSNEMEVPAERTFYEFFSGQVEKNPGRVAVVANDRQLTYGELDRLAGKLAGVLCAQGVGEDKVVAVMLDRSLEMIVGVMGTIKAGGAYLPIDPAYPPGRIAFVLGDSQAPWLVGRRGLLAGLDQHIQGQVIDIEKIVPGPGEQETGPDFPPALPGPGSPVYVIYTSGSTGQPKGVMVEHRHFVNVSLGWRREYRLAEMEVNLLQIASFSFDVFAGDLSRTLVNGGKMVVTPEGVMDPEYFYRLMAIHRISLLESTPSYVIPFMEYIYSNRLSISSLRLLILGSDTCPRQDFKRLVERFSQQMRIVNSYGVTEAAIDTSFYEEADTGNLPDRGQVPIGKPLPNMKFFILDAQGKPLPIGIPGELFIGGDSLARGYLNNPELTAEKFMYVGANNYSPLRDNGVMRLYRTGDRARWLPDGNVEFLGRGDNQVKIRGFRIELGEIENRLLEYGPVREAVVVQKGERSEDRYLCGYIVADQPLSAQELRTFLAQKLPDYMIPWFFVQVERLPLTPNGKVDRQALPEPETNEKTPYSPPQDETEQTLVDIWSQVLGLSKDEIGIDNNFFDLGGNSLRAIVVSSRIHRSLDVKIQLTDIFEIQTIRGIARFISTAAKQSFAAIQPAPKKDFYPLSPAQKRLYILQRIDAGNTVYNMPNVVKLDGGISKERLTGAANDLIHRHESLRTSFIVKDGEPGQQVQRPGETGFSPEFFQLAPGHESEQLAAIIKGFIRPFDLSRAPLLRIGLVDTARGEQYFLADIHHIVSDGVSQNLLVRDFLALYEGRVLPELRLQYKDFAEWQNHPGDREKGALKKQEEYWLQEYAGQVPVLALPTDFVRPEVQSFSGRYLTFPLGKELSAGIKALTAKTDTTLYMFLLAAFNVLLSRYANQEDIVVGTVIAGRQHPDLENIIGMFVNTLAIRNFPGREKLFKDFLDEVRTRALKAFENQDYPFEDLIGKLTIARDTGRNPLFDVVFVLENVADRTESLHETLVQAGERPAKFDLTLYALDRGDYIGLTCEYCDRLFQPETIEAMSRDYTRILQTVTDNPGVKLKDIDLYSRMLPLKGGFPQVGLTFKTALAK